MMKNPKIKNGKAIGLLLGSVLFGAMLLLPVPAGMSLAAWRVAATTVLMAVFWVSEALPIPATALLPIVFFPIFGIMDSPTVTASYGSNVIYLFMGGFFLAVTMERWNLHRRIALQTIRLTGTTPSKMILGFTVATFLLSMWVSNTACAVMMTPIGIAVASALTGQGDNAERKAKEANFTKSLMLMIAYASTIGGITTIIATPANAIAVGMLQNSYGLSITFLQWMLVGLPLGVVMVCLVWLILTKLLYRTGDLQLLGGQEVIDAEVAKLGAMTLPEKRVLAVAAFMVISWISRGFITLESLAMFSDTQIAIIGSVLLFMVPAGNGEQLLDWPTALKIPWGICLLFGGGMAIASAFERSGLARWISEALVNIDGLTLVTAVAISTAVVCCLTEITSNTAIATLFIPIMGATAISLGIHPFATVMAICFASSMCFALPVATPPNAIVFASGYIDIKDMAYAGLILNFVTMAMVVLAVLWWLPLVWGVDLGNIPPAVVEFLKLP